MFEGAAAVHNMTQCWKCRNRRRRRLSKGYFPGPPGRSAADDASVKVSVVSMGICNHLLLTLCAVAFFSPLLIAGNGWDQYFNPAVIPLTWQKFERQLQGTPIQARCKNFPSAGDELMRRGNQLLPLLHPWADVHLFQRAITVGKTVSLPQRSSLSTFSSKESDPSLSKLCSAPKIAFLFLARGALPFAPLWNQFFEGNKNLYSIYVHMDPMRLSAISQSSGVFWKRLVPSERAEPLTPGVIAAARRLLANALLDDPRNEWFALLSDSCVPLHSFSHTYRVISSSQKSMVDVKHNNRSDLWYRYIARGEDAMMPEIPFSQFGSGSPFWIMRRRHARLTVADTRYWEKFNKPCLEEYRYCFPEEHYFATILSIVDTNGTTGYTTTFVDWSKMEDEGDPRTFYPHDIDENLINDLQRREDGRFLFARKFHPDCLQGLLNVSHAILQP